MRELGVERMTLEQRIADLEAEFLIAVSRCLAVRFVAPGTQDEALRALRSNSDGSQWGRLTSESESAFVQWVTLDPNVVAPCTPFWLARSDAIGYREKGTYTMMFVNPSPRTQGWRRSR
jgi:hypothetical protein